MRLACESDCPVTLVNRNNCGVRHPCPYLGNKAELGADDGPRLKSQSLFKGSNERKERKERKKISHQCFIVLSFKNPPSPER